MTRSITHKDVELLPWPSNGCKGCFFLRHDSGMCHKGFDSVHTYHCIHPSVIWLTKEEWLKRRIRE